MWELMCEQWKKDSKKKNCCPYAEFDDIYLKKNGEEK